MVTAYELTETIFFQPQKEDYNCKITIKTKDNTVFEFYACSYTWLKSRRVGVDSRSGLAMPDLMKIANAYGIKTFEMNNHNEMGARLKEILKSKVPVLCSVKIDEKQKVTPKLEFGRSIHDMSPRLSESELNAEMIK